MVIVVILVVMLVWILVIVLMVVIVIMIIIMTLTIMICLYRVSTEPQKGLTGVLVVKKHLLWSGTKDTKRHLHQDLSSLKSKITVMYNDKNRPIRK